MDGPQELHKALPTHHVLQPEQDHRSLPVEHRVGGLEKQDGTGNVCYDADNHQLMTDLRAEKVARVVADVPDLEVHGNESGKVLLVGWGSTFGAIRSAVNRSHEEGLDVSQIHIRHICPFPANLGDILSRFEKVIVPEMNAGQLVLLLRARYLVDAQGLNKVEGMPFKVREIMTAIQEAHA